LWWRYKLSRVHLRGEQFKFLGRVTFGSSSLVSSIWTFCVAWKIETRSEGAFLASFCCPDKES